MSFREWALRDNVQARARLDLATALRAIYMESPSVPFEARMAQILIAIDDVIETESRWLYGGSETHAHPDQAS